MPWNIYENLIKLAGYRGMTLTSEPATKNKVIEALTAKEYIAIDVARSEEDIRGKSIAKFVVIAPGSTYATKSADLRKLINLLTTKQKCDLLLVSDKLPTAQIKKVIAEANGKIAPAKIELYTYSLFSIEVPRHVNVPLHEIITPAEMKEIFSYQYRIKEDMPKILVTDPMAIWLGLVPGMVVKIHRLSETAGNATAYRICVKQGDQFN